MDNIYIAIISALCVVIFLSIKSLIYWSKDIPPAFCFPGCKYGLDTKTYDKIVNDGTYEIRQCYGCEYDEWPPCEVCGKKADSTFYGDMSYKEVCCDVEPTYD